MTGILNNLLVAPAWLVYLTVGALVFAEDAIFVGFIIPGETAAVIGGVASATGNVDVRVMCLIVVVAAIVGDSVGFEVGRLFGPRLLRIKILAKHQHRLADAQALLARRGGAAVFLGRWTAFFRAVMPALAGLSQMPYGRFIRWNAIGGAAWGLTFVLLGHFAGHSYAQIEKTVGRTGAIVVAVIVVVGLIVWQIRKHRIEAVDEATDAIVAD